MVMLHCVHARVIARMCMDGLISYRLAMGLWHKLKVPGGSHAFVHTARCQIHFRFLFHFRFFVVDAYAHSFSRACALGNTATLSKSETKSEGSSSSIFVTLQD